jgi:subtilisin family serine protease
LPGAAGGVISAGSSNEKKQSSVFSNFGRTVDILAPGENILGRYGGRVFSLNGTSFSAPIVVGVVSLMLDANHSLSWKQAEYILKQTSTPVSCSEYCPSHQEQAMHNLCRNYCCQNDQQICTKGIVNAKNAVVKAKAGIPDLALVDIDDYYIALSDDNNFTARALVKNWGKKGGVVRMKALDRNIKIVPSTFAIASMDSRGAPGSKEIAIHYDAIVDSPVISSFILEIANLDNPKNFHDQIEAIVEIVPDVNTKRVKRLLDLPIN